jgi:hypothetical protein
MQYSDRQIREAQEILSQQEALVQRMIARGTPTQAAEDRLRQLEQTFVSHERAPSQKPRLRRSTENP